MIKYSCGLSLVCTMNTVRLYLSLSSGPSVSRSIYSVLQLTNNQHTVGFNWIFFVSFTRPFFLCQSSVSNLSNNTDVSSILLQEFHGGSDFQDYSVCTFRGKWDYQMTVPYQSVKEPLPNQKWNQKSRLLWCLSFKRSVAHDAGQNGDTDRQKSACRTIGISSSGSHSKETIWGQLFIKAPQ